MNISIFILFAIFASTLSQTDRSYEDQLKLAQDNYQILAARVTECILESEIPEPLAKRVLDDDLSDDSDETKVRNFIYSLSQHFKMILKCFIRCFYKKNGYFNENDEPIRSVFLQSLNYVNIGRSDPIDIEGLVDKCLAIQSDEPCDFAYQVSLFYQTTS